MGVTVDVLLSWRPEKLSEIVDNLLADQRGLQRMDDDLDLARPSTFWVGDDADAARVQHEGLCRQAAELVAEVRAVAKACDLAEGKMTTAREDVVQALAVARALQMRVQHDPLHITVDPDAAAMYNPEGSDPTLDDRAHEIEQEIRSALGRAHAADLELAGVLDSVADGLYHPTGPVDRPGPVTPIRELLKLTDPTPAQVNLIRQLLPAVTGADAEKLFDEASALEKSGGDASHLARSLTGNLALLAAYARWFRKHRDMDPAPLTKGQLDYLHKVAGLWKDDVDPQGERPPRENPLREILDIKDQQIANSILILSDPDLGGGYDALPEDVRQAAEQRAYDRNISDGVVEVIANDKFFHLSELVMKGDLPAGADFSKILAEGVAESVKLEDSLPDDRAIVFSSDREGFRVPRPDGLDDDTMSDVLKFIARDGSVVDDLVRGDDLPEGMSSRDFVSSVFRHDWPDDGAGVASLVDAMDSDLRNPTDPDAAFNDLVRTVTGTGEHKTFSEMMNPGGPSATDANPELTKSLIRKLGDHLPEFETESGLEGSGPLDKAEKMRLMMLLASDQENDSLLAKVIAARQQDNLETWLGEGANGGDSTSVAGRNVRLSTMLDASLNNVNYERTYDANLTSMNEAEAKAAAEQYRADTIEDGIKQLNLVLSGLPGGRGAGMVTSLVDMVLDPSATEHTPEHHHPGPQQVPPNWSPHGNHVSQSAGEYLVQRLEQSGRLDVDGLHKSGEISDEYHDRIRHPERHPGDNVTAAYKKVLDSVLGEDRSFTVYDAEVTKNFHPDADELSIASQDQAAIEEMLKSPDWLASRDVHGVG